MNSAKKARLQKSLVFWTETLDELMKAHTALVKGGVQRFRIEDRELTHFDIPNLLKEILAAEKRIEDLEAKLAGYGSRKIVGIVPRDW
jgi:hypothetical protein